MWAKKNKGVITIFMSLILVSMVLLEGMLVDGSRMRVAETQVTRAAETASRSALTNFDKDLKDRYGLFAFQGTDGVQGIVKEYMDKNLTIPSSKSGSLNLYDYRVDSLDVAAAGALDNLSVFRGQILEYMKYRAPLNLMESFFKQYTAIKESNVVAETMSKKEALDKKLKSLENLYKNYSEKSTAFNEYNKEQLRTNTAILPSYSTSSLGIDNYLSSIYLLRTINRYKESEEYKKDNMKTNSIINSFHTYVRAQVGRNFDTVTSIISDGIGRANKLQSAIENLMAALDEAQKAFKEYESYVSNLKEDSVETQDVKEFIASTKAELEVYRKSVDRTVFEKDLATVKSDIQILNSINGIIRSANSSVNDSANTRNFNIDVFHDMISKVTIPDGQNSNDVYPKFMAQLQGYKELNDMFSEFINGTIKGYGSDINNNLNNFSFVSNSMKPKTKDPDKEKSLRDAYEKQKKNQKTEEFKFNKLEGIYSKSLPSESSHGDTGFSFTGEAYASDNGVKSETAQSLDIVSAIIKSLGDSLISIRDKVYINEYVMDRFKDVVYNQIEFNSKQGINPEGKIVERVPQLIDEDTILNAEIEYILGSSTEDSKNYLEMKAKIYAVRYFLNFAHLASDTTGKMLVLEEIAWASAGWTGNPAIVCAVKWTLAAMWTALETYEDLSLITSGYAVPLYKDKSSNSWITQPLFVPDGDVLYRYRNGQIKSAVMLGYTDYCRIFLLLQGEDTTLKRTMDMVHVNMLKEEGEKFSLGNCLTTLRVNTTVSMKYIFGTKAIAPKLSRGSRYEITKTLYQSY